MTCCGWAQSGLAPEMDILQLHTQHNALRVCFCEGRLTGTLNGVSSMPSLPLSTEGHAHRLIEEATDKNNLGQMYIWWMPWL